MCATRVSTGDQGGMPTLPQWPQCYRVWNEIDIFQISDKKLNYALNHVIDYNTITSKWISSVLYFYEIILKFVVNKLSHKKLANCSLQFAHCLQWTDILDVPSSRISLWAGQMRLTAFDCQPYCLDIYSTLYLFCTSLWVVWMMKALMHE